MQSPSIPAPVRDISLLTDRNPQGERGMDIIILSKIIGDLDLYNES